MKLLCCHPSGLMYTEAFLRLEPLGLELVAAAAQRAGHEVRAIDLQVFAQDDYWRVLDDWKPDAVAFSLNYLANVPEVIDLVKETKRRRPLCLTIVGGHSASFIAGELLEHAAGSIEVIARGEGEATIPALLAAAQEGSSLHLIAGAVTPQGEGTPPKMVEDLDALIPARHLMGRRRKYFIGVLDPAASIEFSRGCPWDCAFCSAWTFYGRSYRRRSAEHVGEELAGIAEPGIFIVDDVAFVHAEHGFAIGREIERRHIRKRYYLETRGDVLLRNREVFRYWKRLGLEYMFLGIEAIDEEGLKLHRKRIKLSANFEALEVARSLGISVAVNIIADPTWDERRFQTVREWALSIPEIVNISVNTPYPGTETFQSEASRLSTRDYRLFDIQHAVMPTKLPLARFYQELVKTQRVLNTKHLGFSGLMATAGIALRLLAKGQTNFVRMLWKWNGVFNPRLQLADHDRPVTYAMRLPTSSGNELPRDLYVLRPYRAPVNSLTYRRTAPETSSAG